MFYISNLFSCLTHDLKVITTVHIRPVWYSCLSSFPAGWLEEELSELFSWVHILLTSNCPRRAWKGFFFFSVLQFSIHNLWSKIKFTWLKKDRKENWYDVKKQWFCENWDFMKKISIQHLNLEIFHNSWF